MDKRLKIAASGILHLDFMPDFRTPSYPDAEPHREASVGGLTKNNFLAMGQPFGATT